MTLKYINSGNALQTDSTVSKVEPVLNGVSLLITATGSTYVIPAKSLVEITT